MQPASSKRSFESAEEYNRGVNSLTRRHFFQASALAAFSRRLQALPLADIKLGVTTDEIDEDVTTAVRFLKEFGLGYAEVRNIWGKYNTAQPVEKVREAKTIFDEYRIQTSILGTGFFKVPLPAETAEGNAALDKQWTLLEGAIERAKALGTDKIRVFAFTYEKGETPDAKKSARIYELVNEAARRAKSKNMRLALENVGGSYVLTGAESAALLHAVKADNVGLTWDPNNSAISCEHAFPDGYQNIAPA